MVFEKDSIEQEDIAKNKDEKRRVGEAKIIVSRSHPGPVKANLEVLEKHLGFCLDNFDLLFYSSIASRVLLGQILQSRMLAVLASKHGKWLR